MSAQTTRPGRCALVLSGGGLFGAWQAGAWRVLQERFQPDLVVGASVGSLNGYLIASGIDSAELCDRWRDPQFADFRQLDLNIQKMIEHYRLRQPFAVTLVDMLRLKPRTFCDGDITWKHLAASC